jgi:hypothetical protein
MLLAIAGNARPLQYIRVQIVRGCNQILTYRL